MHEKAGEVGGEGRQGASVSTKDWIEKDFYKVLGVSKTAEQDEIKKAYRKLAWSTTRTPTPGDAKAEARFKEISEAYDVLGDVKKRKEYDEARRLFGGGGFRMPGGSGQGSGFGFDVGDLFNRGGASVVAGSATSSAGCSPAVAGPPARRSGRAAARTSSPRRRSSSPRR